MRKLPTLSTLACTTLLTAYGTADTEEQAAAPVTETIRTCDSIRDGIINLASGRGVTIVKIYEPKTIIDKPEMISCSGRAMVDSGQQVTLYYRNYKDQEGDWLLEYSEEPLK